MAGFSRDVRRRELAAILLFAAITQFALAANISEAVYPGYSIRNTLLSDLGVWGQPAALLFNASLVAFGLLGLGIGFLTWGDRELTFIPLLFALCGTGMLIMATFPITVDWAHDAGAFLAFVLIALAMMCCYWTYPGPFGSISMLLGVFALITMVLYKAQIDFGLGLGSMERVFVYPIMMWMAAFGTALFMVEEDPEANSLLHRFFGWASRSVKGHRSN